MKGGRPLRLLATAVYLALGVAALAVAAPALRVWILILLRPAILPPRLPPPLPWGLAVLAILGSLYLILQGVLAGRSIRRGPASVLLVAVVAVFSGAALLPRAAIIPPSLPRARLAGAFGAASARLREAHRRRGRYPIRFPGGPLRGPSGHRLQTGYWGHGRRLFFHVVSRRPGPGPAVRARASDGPGTLYYRASTDGTTYWLTALMMKGAPVGPIRFARDAVGQALVVTSATSDPGG